jgi:endogenous inhibitor of DNA gyrase (YacG/DUF329 family)
MATETVQKLLSVTETADLIGCSSSQLNKWRMVGEGPPFMKLGARVLYNPADLAAWLEEQKRRSTQDTGAPAGGWPRFPDEAVRAAVVAAESEPFVASYLDPARWAAETKTITARTETARHALARFSLRAIFADLAVTLSDQVGH